MKHATRIGKKPKPCLIHSSLFLIGWVIYISHVTGAELPNVVFVLTDDMGYGDVSAYNTTKSAVETIHIDKLAETGFRFTNGHTSAAICSPTRYSIMTGEHSYHIGREGDFENNYSEVWFKPGQRTLGDLARAAGYHTGYVGKWHIGYTVYNTNGSKMAVSNSSAQSPAPDWSKGISDHPYDHGFDFAFGHTSSADIPPYKYFESDTWIDEEASWITKALALSTGIADDPADGTDVSTIRNGWMDLDWDFNQIQRRLTDKALEFITAEAQTDSVLFFLFFAPSGPHTPNVPHPDFQGITVHNYTDYVYDIDAMVGELIAKLKEQEVYSNTIIIVTSDNGANRSQANFSDHQGTGVFEGTDIRGQKGTIFEGGHRVPLVMHWGDDTDAGSVMKSGISTNELISTQDFFRTFAALWEVALADSEGVDSWNMLPAIFGNGQTLRIREANFANSHQRHFAITKQFEDGTEFKLIYSTGSGGWDDPVGTRTEPNQAWADIDLSTMQLYNLSVDIGESENLLSDGVSAIEEAIAQELHTLMYDYMLNKKSNAHDPDTSRGWTPVTVSVKEKGRLSCPFMKVFRTGDVISVELGNYPSEAAQLRLLSINGAVIAQKSLEPAAKRVIFNVSRKTGVMLLHLMTEQGNVIQKIII
jgi:arylsulfatase A-like enzyme